MVFFDQYPVLIPFTAILAAEMVKAFVDLVSRRSSIRFLHPGGMPSGHSAFVSALVVTVAYHEGIGSVAFMISATFALVVMFDAIHLRNEAGFHARFINQLLPRADLEESLGHTHIEVIVGAFFGAAIAGLLLFLSV